MGGEKTSLDSPLIDRGSGKPCIFRVAAAAGLNESPYCSFALSFQFPADNPCIVCCMATHESLEYFGLALPSSALYTLVETLRWGTWIDQVLALAWKCQV